MSASVLYFDRGAPAEFFPHGKVCVGERAEIYILYENDAPKCARTGPFAVGSLANDDISTAHGACTIFADSKPNP